MRLHHLQATAFGPFAETVHVDFDRLSGAGLFLLSGPTGAGKSSVLDAVCFGLYGDVPGDRSTAKRLRSDHAAASAAPRVELEATLAGRRFRLVRSPAWERPKKRGQGTTAQQASVVVSERIGREWVTLSTRLDEAGHLVTSLVGMNLPQFTQVAMLPQGRFQAFLRARSEERHQLLQRLFRTGRFEQVERWLRDRRLELQAQSRAAHQGVADLASRVSEAAGAPLPPGCNVKDLSPVAHDETLAGWSHALLSGAEQERGVAVEALTSAAAAEEIARQGWEDARRRAEQVCRVRGAVQERGLLLAAAGDRAEDAVTLDAARRATQVFAVQRLALSAQAEHDSVTRTAQDAVASASALLGLDASADGIGSQVASDLAGDPDDDPAQHIDDVSGSETAARISRAVERAADDLAHVRSLLPQQARIVTIQAELIRSSRGAIDLRNTLSDLVRVRDGLPARLETLRVGVSEARDAASAVSTLETQVAQLEDRLAALRLAGRLTEQLGGARAAWQCQHEQTVTLRSSWLDVREERLAGMAAEIAGALAVGACCPVCGSIEHPAKAGTTTVTLDLAEQERAALKALDDANGLEHLRDQEVRDLQTRLAVTTGRGGDTSPEELSRDLVALRVELARSVELAARVETLRSELGAAEQDAAGIQQRLDSLVAELAETEASTRVLETDRGQLRARVAGALQGTGRFDLDSLQSSLCEQRRVGQASLEALDRQRTARRSLRDALVAVEDTAVAAGFASADEALAARRPEPETRRLEVGLAAHERRLAAVVDVLGEPGAEELAACPDLDPDPKVLAVEHQEAIEELDRARSRAGVSQSRAVRLITLVESLDHALTGWAPIREELELTSRLSAFVEGKAGDNALQMRLSAYVLAYRLSQVVAAANQRLARMSDQRYRLEHTARRGAGETRGGLSLLVRDDWTGAARDPATLSGGETFVVSLALALGLADVITQEAGGAELDTLFVDEGFGSLDAETLDDVMDVLDSLRDGGRVVGVVSHVAEMRDRIPTQLVVAKARTGSTVSVRGS